MMAQDAGGAVSRVGAFAAKKEPAALADRALSGSAVSSHHILFFFLKKRGEIAPCASGCSLVAAAEWVGDDGGVS
jgi:hypothetical protein